MSARSIQKGDTIECHDADEMIAIMEDLAKHGIETDFVYEKKRKTWLLA